MTPFTASARKLTISRTRSGNVRTAREMLRSDPRGMAVSLPSDTIL